MLIVGAFYICDVLAGKEAFICHPARLCEREIGRNV